jgi:long-chain acyl-CoA synthetase
VFPEGGRSRDGSIKEFKKGVGIIARELNMQIVPAAINGTYEMLAPGKRFPRPAKVSVTFGKPIHPGDMDYDGIVKKLYEEVVNLLGKEEVRSRK